MKLIFKNLKPYRKQILLGCLLLACACVAELMLPTIMSNIVNNGINKQDVNAIYYQGGLMLGFALISAIAFICSARIISRVSNKFGGEMMKKIFNKADEMTFDQFSKLGASALLTRTTEDVDLFTEAVYFLMRIAVNIPILFFGSVFLASLKSPVLAVIVLAFAPIMVFVIFLLGKRMMPLWETSDKYIDVQNQVLRERLSGIRVIRAFNREGTEHKRLADATNTMADNIIRANIMGGMINPVSILLLNCATVGILFLGARNMTPGAGLSAADIYAIIQYVALVMNCILMFAFAIIFLPRLRIKAKRINEVLDMQTVKEENVKSTDYCGNVRFENVTFKYMADSEESALSDVSFEIKNGTTVAFLGGTGSGKTTVLQLIMGFYKATAGEIYLNEKPYSELMGTEIRNSMSCALQKSAIFSDSIRDNVKMGAEFATDEEVMEVLDIAEIKDYVCGLDEKLNHYLEQAGANLSGGQKQRIAIARAIIKPAGIYIFDDSFSALDFITESKLRKKLNDKLKGKTQIIITQRIATGMSADHIYVFDKGKIVGSGKHKDLLADCEIYRDIYRSQTGGEL